MRHSILQSHERRIRPAVASQRSGEAASIRSAVRCVALLACAWCLSYGTGATIAEDFVTAPLPTAESPAETELTPSVLLDDLEVAARAKQARLERLRRQLLQLGEDSRRAALPRESPVVPTPPPEPAGPPGNIPGEAHAPDQASGLIDKPHAPLQPAPGSNGDPSARSQAEMTPDAAAHGGHVDSDNATGHIPPGGVEHSRQTTEAVVGTRINRLALADSLFATGQAELALQAYNSIQLTKLTVIDRYWVEYQIASCHRRLGNTAEAERRYRALAGLVDGGWCATHARWWLDAISTRTKLQQDLNQIRRTLHSVEEQLHAGPTP